MTSDCFRIVNEASGTVLDLDDGNSANRTRIQGYRRMGGDSEINQTWTLERRSRTHQEIEALLRASSSIGQTFQQYVSDFM